jgi:predicted dehydrogenase
MMGRRKCLQISSFGALTHFRKENKPKEAGKNCLECDYESQCPYSAKKIYLDRVKSGWKDWPVNVITPGKVTEESVLAALEKGQYGRCVYECDNDVVDHQVVNMMFSDNRTASFTMTGFTKATHRRSRFFGTRGEIYNDDKNIYIYDFLTDKTRIINTGNSEFSILDGHGGGDYDLMHSFVSAVGENDRSKILSGPDESLETHLMVFAAEKSRKEGKVVSLQNLE